jgi:hypothetical protein
MGTHAVAVATKVSGIAIDALVVDESRWLLILDAFFIYPHLKVFMDILAAGIDRLHFCTGVLLLENVMSLKLLVAGLWIVDTLALILELGIIDVLIVLYLGDLLVFQT